MTTLYIDADACPVKAEAERVATRLRLPMVLVCNGGLRPSQNPYVSLMIVPEGPDVADQWIAAHCGPGDVVVTADIPLADRCLKAGAQVVQHDGEVLTPANIGGRLATRDLRDTDQRVYDICLKYGFDSQQTFTRIFTRTFHQPPGAYRKENHNRAH